MNFKGIRWFKEYRERVVRLLREIGEGVIEINIDREYSVYIILQNILYLSLLCYWNFFHLYINNNEEK